MHWRNFWPEGDCRGNVRISSKTLDSPCGEHRCHTSCTSLLSRIEWNKLVIPKIQKLLQRSGCHQSPTSAQTVNRIAILYKAAPTISARESQYNITSVLLIYSEQWFQEEKISCEFKIGNLSLTVHREQSKGSTHDTQQNSGVSALHGK